MRKRSAIAGLFLLVAAAALATVVRGVTPDGARASSHREAPLISEDPGADNVDVYAFRSPDRPDTVTLIATYIPLEEPAGGPNFAQFDDDVTYAINVDNDGDAKEDVSYQFRFKTGLRNPNSFLYNTGPITSLDDTDWNRPQSYTVTKVTRDGKREVLGTNVPTPPVNVGVRSTPNYGALMGSAVSTLSDGSKVFAGQVDDPFYVDLGSIFDLAGLRPFNPFHLLPLPAAAGVDNVSGYNTHAIALQVPIAKIGTTKSKVLGIYASASRQAVTVRLPGKERAAGPEIQVSRLGNPLINEVIIPLGQKDQWNGTDPEDDKQFRERYRSPELASLVNLLYPALPDTPTTGRDDLVAVLLTGIGKVPGVTENFNSTGPREADLLRLNFDVPVTAAPKRLGVLEGDLQGFPNGRRLADDVVDIELRAVACGYGPILQSLLGLCNFTPNNTIGDGVDANDRAFSPAFPYLAAPTSGYES
ncbi:MAG TPA: DUF4331 domain-containing protein [Gaiellaceae bacterium]|nr:DUF4331 domain-containing protein [Gaiellaceae bacterium]